MANENADTIEIKKFKSIVWINLLSNYLSNVFGVPLTTLQTKSNASLFQYFIYTINVFTQRTIL